MRFLSQTAANATLNHLEECNWNVPLKSYLHAYIHKWISIDLINR